jgi:hypothetical protein
LGFGRFEKVALALERPFWRDAGAGHLVLFPPEQNEPAVWVLGLDAFGAGPILLAMIFHTSAPRVLDGGGADWLLDLLRQALGLGVGPDRLGGLALGGQPQSERADLSLECPGVQLLGLPETRLLYGHGLGSLPVAHHPQPSVSAGGRFRSITTTGK